MGGGILDVKVPLLERLQVFQTSGAVQEQAVRQPGMGFHCHPLGRQHGSQLLCGDFEGVYLGTGGGLAVVGGQHIDAGGGGFVFDGPRDAREADGDLLKQPQAAGRLGQRVLPGFCLAHGRFVQGADPGKQALQPLFILCHTITPIVPVLRASEGSGGPA